MHKSDNNYKILSVRKWEKIGKKLDRTAFRANFYKISHHFLFSQVFAKPDFVFQVKYVSI